MQSVIPERNIVVVVFCVVENFKLGTYINRTVRGGLFDIEHTGTVNYGERGVSGI